METVAQIGNDSFQPCARQIILRSATDMVPIAGTLIQIAEKVSAGLPLIVYQVQARLFEQFILAGPCDEKLCVSRHKCCRTHR